MSHNFHITPEDGIARPCSGNCRYGDNVISGDTAEEAQYNYAASKGIDKLPSLKKEKGDSDNETISEDNINQLLQDYDLDFGNSEIIENGDELTIIVESHNNSTVMICVDKDSTVGELKKSILEEIESFDAEESFEENWNNRIIPADVGAGQVILSAQADAEHFASVGAKLREDLGLGSAPQPYSPNNTKHHEELKDSYSEISNTENISEDNAEQLIEDYELSHGNSEIFTQDNEVYMTVEAPDNSTMGISINKDASILETREKLVDYMRDFDASNEFGEIWSEEFGEHNGFSAFQFMEKLKSDEAYFHNTANKIQRDINNM